MRKYRLSVHDGDVPKITWRHSLWRKLWCSWRGHWSPHWLPFVGNGVRVSVLCGRCLTHLYTAEATDGTSVKARP